MTTFTINQSGQVRKETVGDVNYLVAPVVAARAGKLNEPVSTEELTAHFLAWNGTPFVLGHPVDADGTHVSANDPLTLDKTQLGHLFNVSMDDDKLKGEVWINLAWADAVERGREVVTRLEKKEPLEVSVAFFRDFENQEARNLRPDHFAALLDEKGACNWQDGCGAPRVNSEAEPETNQAAPPAVTVAPGDQPQSGSIVKLALDTLARALGFNQDQEEKGMDELIQKILEDGRLELNAEELGTMSERHLGAVAKLLELDQESKPEPEPQETEPVTEAAPAPAANVQDCPKLVALVAAIDARGGPERVFALLDGVQANAQEGRDTIIDALVANEACLLDKGMLATIPTDQLQALERSFIKPNYSGLGELLTPGSAKYSTRVNSRVPAKEKV